MITMYWILVMIETAILQKLDRHQHIAYDLDGTLFGIYGRLLEEYISSNPTKTHSVITSRQSTCVDMSMNQLRQLFGDIFDLPFKHIIHSSSPTLEGHQVDPNFKGNKCREIGATAMVDDWQYHETGCRMNSIDFVFIHALV